MPQPEDLSIDALLVTAQSRLLQATMHIAHMRVAYLHYDHQRFWQEYKACADEMGISSRTIVDVADIKSLVDTRGYAQPAGGVN